MITIVARNIIIPDQIDAFKTLAADYVAKCQQEPGNISFDLFQDIKAPEVLTFIEEWEDRDAIDAHVKTVHYAEMVPEMTNMYAEPKEVRLYEKV